MKTKYTFSEKDVVEFLNTPDYEKEFVIDHLCFLNGLYDIEDVKDHCAASRALEIEFLKACIEYQDRKTKRIKAEAVFLRVKTWKVEVHSWALKSLTNLLLDSGLVIRDEETEHLFQEREYKVLIRSFQ